MYAQRGEIGVDGRDGLRVIAGALLRLCAQDAIGTRLRGIVRQFFRRREQSLCAREIGQRQLHLAERAQKICARACIQIACACKALLGGGDERVGGRALVARQVRARRIEHAEQEIAGRIRALRLPARHVRLPQCRAKRGKDAEHEQRGDRNAAAMALYELACTIGARGRVRDDRATTKIIVDVVGECAGRGIAALRFLGQCLERDVVEVAAQLLAQARALDAWDVGVERFVDARRRSSCRRAAGLEAQQQLVQQHTEAVNVGRGGDRAAAQLFRRSVAGGEHADGTRRVRIVFLDQLGDTEVEQLHRAVGRDQDV